LASKRLTDASHPVEIPTAIGLGTNLIGTDDLVRDRLRLYRDVGITTVRANLCGDAHADFDRRLGDLERLLDPVRQVNDEIESGPAEIHDR
jgi:alkanesulfonate monooxygenase SsuD/methylene tetrahydromethanopterin reductase-like flavin-dependent oxidoreductase (luciferase family)